MQKQVFPDRRPSAPFSSLPQLLEHQANRIPDVPAILAPGRAPLTYGRLYEHILETGRALRAMGIGRHDRIAVVLPNGPEMAVAVLAVATHASCAPMNPAYQAEELDRYFADLRPRALITQAGIDVPARRAALPRGVRVIELASEADTAAGCFSLPGEAGGGPLLGTRSPTPPAGPLAPPRANRRPNHHPPTPPP